MGLQDHKNALSSLLNVTDVSKIMNKKDLQWSVGTLLARLKAINDQIDQDLSIEELEQIRHHFCAIQDMRDDLGLILSSQKGLQTRMIGVMYNNLDMIAKDYMNILHKYSDL